MLSKDIIYRIILFFIPDVELKTLPPPLDYIPYGKGATNM